MRLVPLFMAAVLIFVTVLVWPSADGDVGILGWINVTVMLVLSLLLLRYGMRLLRERTEPKPGSRLRAKLVVGLVGLLLVPAMVIQLAASQMVERGMDVWFDVRVDTLLDRALNLAQGFYERLEKDMKRSLLGYISDGVLVAAVGGNMEYLATTAYLTEIREREGWQKAELFDLNERQLGGVQVGELSALEPEPLSDAARLSMRLGRVATELKTGADGEVAVGYAPLIGTTSVVGLLRVEMKLPAGVIQNARSVESDYRNYRQLEHNRQAIAQTFTHVILFVTLAVLLLAGLIGLLFARRLTAPIGDLAHALHRVTEGDLDVVLDEMSQDELGSLVRSFNEMTSRLRHHAGAIEQGQQDLTKALDKSRQRQFVLESLLANLHTGVLLVDGSGRVRLLNQAVRDILHLPVNWVPSVDLLQASQGNLQDIGDFYNELKHQQEEHLQREFDISLPDSRLVHVLARGARLNASASDFSGYLLVIDDISELAEAQRNKAWAEVARRLAHEIKNPLTPIKLSAERLQRRFRAQVDNHQVFDACTQAIIAQVERLQRLIADFSTLARMPQPKIRDVSVNVLLREMKDLFHGYRRIEVRFCDEQWRCACDPDQVRQVLINLMDNAVSASDDGVSIRLYASLSDAWVEWHVEDDGDGIDEAAASRLFEAYYSTKASGSGLGLAIAKRIAEDHHGELLLVSTAAPTHFCLRLPRYAAEEGA
ncbi:MAG: PAS domain-containing sensor histidine kinase [Zetaproteobacteria bacterium CG12_big_fil_rev_8_21_14_0_65_54_13]|nr:MAG: PAS domain-containing sensor histidine kinase [Zetaproteobacteria bacterium CG23_combo_of_CG06-09_8_20_14_all_54_7]PIW46787.1 MAG: PAS domain-containing sensor histidine kinase [Zetaproteobacteria bacterium CG12_big_fil_rev_8_21_14_0_65_54_13]PIX55544.1 MAG: PAS domain-containing sensor histidine kinase [Zetaproteobacteria bacterium CG_4_10_14_3_um_filter_54_28]PJA27522.1 MAG: PAS domain-containing sensor histidine kinase [Zetaproteobacteria bacterium CG_4_9_14_3_um_filter_54_145]